MKNQSLKTSPAASKRSGKTTKSAADITSKNPLPVEVGGPKGPEPTRYGDWEQAGRCTDF